MSVGVLLEQASRSFQCSMIPNTCKDIQNFPLVLRRIAHTVGRQKREAELFSQFNGLLVDRFLLTIEMALQFNINVAAAKDMDEAFQSLVTVFVPNRLCQRTMFAAGKTNQATR